MKRLDYSCKIIKKHCFILVDEKRPYILFPFQARRSTTPKKVCAENQELLIRNSISFQRNTRNLHLDLR